MAMRHWRAVATAAILAACPGAVARSAGPDTQPAEKTPNPVPATQPTVRLFQWERGIAVESLKQKDRAVYFWFYEWNMFDAVRPGMHTENSYKRFQKQVNEQQTEARIQAADITVAMKAGDGQVDLTLTITNRSDHDWPRIAGIIPCFNPGPDVGPNQPASKRQFVNTKTFFLGPHGLDRLDKRHIHFNDQLRPEIDKAAPDGKFVFSEKWPTSQPDAKAGVLIRESNDGQWVTGIAWERFLSAQGHNAWHCMHLGIQVGPLKRGQSTTIRGAIYLFAGAKEDCLARFRNDFEIDAPGATP